MVARIPGTELTPVSHRPAHGDLDQGSANFFCNEPVSKCFQLMGHMVRAAKDSTAGAVRATQGDMVTCTRVGLAVCQRSILVTDPDAGECRGPPLLLGADLFSNISGSWSWETLQKQTSWESDSLPSETLQVGPHVCGEVKFRGWRSCKNISNHVQPRGCKHFTGISVRFSN